MSTRRPHSVGAVFADLYAVSDQLHGDADAQRNDIRAKQSRLGSVDLQFPFQAW